jgi:hypothetical protein
MMQTVADGIGKQAGHAVSDIDRRERGDDHHAEQLVRPDADRDAVYVRFATIFIDDFHRAS